MLLKLALLPSTAPHAPAHPRDLWNVYTPRHVNTAWAPHADPNTTCHLHSTAHIYTFSGRRAI